MRNAAICGVVGGIVAVVAGGASATPLEMSYITTDLLNGTWLYEFELTNLNLDGSWLPGHTFNFIIFGDAPAPPTALTGWVGDPNSLQGTPFFNEGFADSSGGHNGPTLIDVDNGLQGWVPGFVGDSISWSGTATVDLAQGELLWSNINGTGVMANFAVANKVPAPGAAAVLAIGGLVAARRRR